MHGSPPPPAAPVSKPINRINLAKALKLRLVNRLSVPEIAAHFGVTKQSVDQALARFSRLCADPDIAHAYEQSRPALLSAVEEQMLQSLVDPAKVEKASLGNVAYALTQVSQLRRLESGQSTVNGAFVNLVILADKRLGKHPNKQIPVDDGVHNAETPIVARVVEDSEVE